jgi:hypothetical protein
MPIREHFATACHFERSEESLLPFERASETEGFLAPLGMTGFSFSAQGFLFVQRA